MAEQLRTPEPPPLTSGRWALIEQWLEQALAYHGAERDTVIAHARCEDPTLGDEVASLVEASEDGEGPLERLAATLDERIDLRDLGTAPPGRCGPYDLVREIGRGGMGVVYLARRADGQYDREVALKLVQAPGGDSHLRDRFLAERQILARLSHPNIARLLDGGVTERGLPYFTMEYVDGVPLDRYADERRLDVRARLALFVRVADAVAALHRSLVIHRDLKPGNVLVTGDGEVKLVDFGIARLLDEAGRSSATRTVHRQFTYDFASPEQISGGPLTTSTDVYSLGAMLYVLLAGVPPHWSAGDTLPQMERAILEADVVRPSTVFSAATARQGSSRVDVDEMCRARSARPDQLERQLSGDLDVICTKALQKDPARRYGSVDLLRQDVEHYLRGLPVAARPDGWAYQAGKFLKRHRLGMAAAVLIAASLIGGLVASTIAARRAEAERRMADVERDRARVEARRAEHVSTLVANLFKLASPEQARGGTIPALELLDRGTERIGVELAADPATQAAMYGVAARVYSNLGILDRAESLLVTSLELARASGGEDSLTFADLEHDLGGVRLALNQYERAEASLRHALDVRRRLGARSEDLAASLEGLGELLSETNRLHEGEPYLREAVAIRRQHPGPAADGTMSAVYELGLLLHRQGKFAESGQLFREAVEIGRRRSGTNSPVKVSSMLHLARLVHTSDRNPAGAVPLYEEALTLARELYARDHEDTATIMSEMARALRDSGRTPEAVPLMRDALAMWHRLYGPRHREVMIATQVMASLLYRTGQNREAERLYRETLSMGLSLFGESHPLVFSAQEFFATFLEGERRFAEAEGLRRTTLEQARRAFGEQHVHAARAWAALGQHQMLAGRLAEAEAPLRRALELRLSLHPPTHWRIAEAKVSLGTWLLRMGRLDEAEPLLRDGLAGLQAAGDASAEAAKEANRRLVELDAARRR